MPNRLLAVILVVFLSAIVEFFFSQVVGDWMTPNLVLLAVVFFNLLFGIRYSLFAALLAGSILDSWSINHFGIHVFTFMVCAVVTTLCRRYLYQPGSRLSLWILVLTILFVNFSTFIILSGLQDRFYDLGQSIRFVFLPEILLTLIFTRWSFKVFQKCVQSFSK